MREDHDRILEVTGWISPDVQAWIERHSRVPTLLDAADGATDVDFLTTTLPFGVVSVP